MKFKLKWPYLFFYKFKTKCKKDVDGIYYFQICLLLIQLKLHQHYAKCLSLKFSQNTFTLANVIIVIILK